MHAPDLSAVARMRTGSPPAPRPPRGSRRGLVSQAAARWPARRCTPPSRERWVSRPTHQRQPSHAFAIIALARLEVDRRSPKPGRLPASVRAPTRLAASLVARRHSMLSRTSAAGQHDRQPRAVPRSPHPRRLRLCAISCLHRPARTTPCTLPPAMRCYPHTARLEGLCGVSRRIRAGGWEAITRSTRQLHADVCLRD